MYPVFIELTYWTGEKVMINVNMIKTVKQRFDSEKKEFTTILTLLPNASMVQVKETPKDIEKKTIQARETFTIELFERLRGMGYLK